MDSERARTEMSAYLKEQFGKIVELRQVSVERSAAGRIWVGIIYLVSLKGEIEIGRIAIDESGQVTEVPTVDDLIDILISVAFASNNEESPAAVVPSAADDFSDLIDDKVALSDVKPTLESMDLSEVDAFFADLDHSDLRAEIARLLTSSDLEDLEQAQRLLPQLLVEPAGRGSVLRQMGELENKLGNKVLAAEYFEAAAQEFTHRGDLDALEYIVERASSVSENKGQAVKQLFEQLKFKLDPIAQLDQVPAFAGLGDEELFEITGSAQLVRLATGQALMREGEPATAAYVVKSGLLQVELETPDGSNQLARCCFPSEFVGETSVLGKEGATCNATVIAARPTVLWRFEGQRLRDLALEYSELKARIEEARTIHRVDSFFVMNKATGALDARVRDKLLGCIQTIKRVDAGTVLGKAGNVPKAAFLISEGTIECRKSSGETSTITKDSFVSLGDTLHELELEGDLVAATPCRLLIFDTNRLKSFAASAPPQVVAVLERLGQ